MARFLFASRSLGECRAIPLMRSGCDFRLRGFWPKSQDSGGMLRSLAEEVIYEPRRSLQRRPAGSLLSSEVLGCFSGAETEKRGGTLRLDGVAGLSRSIPGFCIRP